MKKIPGVLGLVVGLGLVAAAAWANAASSLFYDNFNRATGDTVGNGWNESPGANVRIVTGGYGPGNLFPPNTPENAMRLKGNPASGSNIDVAATHFSINTTSYLDVHLTFNWKSLDDDGSSDKLFAAFSTDGGTSWNDLIPALSLNDDDHWFFASYVLPSSVENLGNLGIRLATRVNDSDEGVRIDNVNVTAIPEPEIYAMLLAGLGLMGFVAHRRQRYGA